MHKRKNIAIFVSGRGSNMQAIIEAAKKPDFSADIKLIFSNNARAPAIEIAKKHNINYKIYQKSQFNSKKEFEEAIYAILLQYQIDFIILAGYMEILSPFLVAKYHNRILNIHPSLLPLFRGLKPISQALKSGQKISGCTVHIVTNKIDQGKILKQAIVPILAQDDENKLSARILQQEHKIYPEAIDQFIKSNI